MTDGRIVFHYLAQNRNVDFFKLMRGREFDVSTRDESGNTFLHLAARSDSVKAATFFLENGADVHLVNNWGKTALDLAYTYGAKRTMDVLLQYYADPQELVRSFLGRYNLWSHTSREGGLYKAEPLIARLAIVQALGTEITEFTRSQLGWELSWVQYFDKCQREVERMKENTFYGNVGLIEFLKGNRTKIVTLVRNEELVSVLEKIIEEFEENFPYRSLLRNRLEEAIRLLALTEKAITAICPLFSLKNIVPYYTAGNIVDYLSPRDMKNLLLVYGKDE